MLEWSCSSEKANASSAHHCIQTVIYAPCGPSDVRLVNDDRVPFGNLPREVSRRLVVSTAFDAESGCRQAFAVRGVGEERFASHASNRLCGQQSVES